MGIESILVSRHANEYAHMCVCVQSLINHLSTNSHARMSLSSFKLLRLIILRKGDANGREQWTALVVECEISHSAARARCVIAIEMNRAAREGQVARTHLNRFSVFARILSVT